MEVGQAEPVTPPPPKVPRVARLAALAIRVDQLVRAGQVADYADAARLGHITRARMTQIMNLLNLAPDILEEVLHFVHAVGRSPISEPMLRPMTAVADWRLQRRIWADFNANAKMKRLREHQAAS